MERDEYESKASTQAESRVAHNGRMMFRYVFLDPSTPSNLDIPIDK